MQGDAVKTVLFLHPSWLLYLLVIETETVKTLTLIENTIKVAKGDMCVQSLTCIQLCWTWASAHQASLSFTVSQSFLKSMSIESVMLSIHPILCRPLLLLPSIFPSIKAFSTSQLFASGGQTIGASASASLLPMNIPGWFPLGLNGLISLLSKGFSSLLQHHSSKGSILWRSACFLV